MHNILQIIDPVVNTTECNVHLLCIVENSGNYLLKILGISGIKRAKITRDCAKRMYNYRISTFGFTGSVRRMIRSLSTDTTPFTALKYFIASLILLPSGIIIAMPGMIS